MRRLAFAVPFVLFLAVAPSLAAQNTAVKSASTVKPSAKPDAAVKPSAKPIGGPAKKVATSAGEVAKRDHLPTSLNDFNSVDMSDNATLASIRKITDALAKSCPKLYATAYDELAQLLDEDSDNEDDHLETKDQLAFWEDVKSSLKDNPRVCS